jgi:hypothetical protein
MVMTTDKVFILLLVIMLPLTGCLDIADTAEAEDSDEENSTTTMPMVHSLHIEEGANATLDFDGTTTMKLETIHQMMPNGNSQYLANPGYQLWEYSMTCDNATIVERGTMSPETFLPVLAGQSCSIFIEPTVEVILVFSKASLTAL